MKSNNITKTRNNLRLNLIKNAELEGELEFPKLKATQTTFSKYELVPFNIAMGLSERKQNYYVHFYIDDYQFDRIWNFPDKYLSLLKEFKGVIMPDFSLYTDMPKAQQIWNSYRSKVLGYYFQSQGLEVIPNASWSDENSFDWCFDGLPQNSVIAVSSIGCMKNPRATLGFCKGFNEMLKHLEPIEILFYGEVPKSLKGNSKIKQIATHLQISLEKYTKGEK